MRQLLLRIVLDVYELLYIARGIKLLVVASATRTKIRALVRRRHVKILLINGRDHHLLLMAIFLLGHNTWRRLIVQEVADPIVLAWILLFLGVACDLVRHTRSYHLILLLH